MTLQIKCEYCGAIKPEAANEMRAAATPAPVEHDSIPLLGYERVITIEWDKHNARRHELIDAKRSRLLSESEISELAELQWLAGIKRELLAGPNVAAPVEQSDEKIETHLGVLPFSLIDEIHERRQTIYRGLDYRVSPDVAAKLKTDLDYLMAFAVALRSECTTHKE